MSFVPTLSSANPLPEPILSLGEIVVDSAPATSHTTTTRRELFQALAQSATLTDVLAQLSRMAQEVLPDANIYYCARRDNGQLGPLETCRAPVPFEWNSADKSIMATLCERASSSGRTRLQTLSRQSRCLAMATPIFGEKGETHVLCAVTEAARDVKLLQAQLESLAAFPSLWHIGRNRTAEPAGAHAPRLLSLLTAMHAASGLAAAASQMANELQQWLGCQRVAVAAPRRGACRLLAVSGQQRIDARSEAAQTLTRALDDIATQQRPIRWTLQMQHDQQPEWPTMRRVASQTGAAVVIGIPLRDGNDQVVAAVLLLLAEDLAPQSWTDVQATLPALAAALNTIANAERAITPRAWIWYRSQKAKLLLAAAALLIGLLLVPIPYRPTSRFTLEPVTRRFIAAPFAGVLERSLAEAGDLVKDGQILARMDDRELRWELASAEAEYHQAAKRYDTALATQSAAAVQLAKFEMEQFQTRINSLRAKMDHLTIRSPLDGVVVRGDLRRSEGAPLTVGQTLFEIAPLDKMVAELEVAEDEVHFLRPGQHVRLRLDADPLRVFTATIHNLHPRAELRHNATVFIAEVHLPNKDLALRPGMNGRAKSSGPWRPLGWVFFRRPIQLILQWAGW